MTTNSVKSIPEFYAGQSIFLTGATGFLGKTFIEKVLRSCPDVREIFLLMRPKNNCSIEDRLKNIINLPLFEKVREERPLNLKKLIPILGDTEKENLGLSIADRQMLTERVTIIIHTAASVRFNESLTTSVFINLRSTRDICILAQNMRNLIALVYVSTIYAHVDNIVIEEKVYPPVTDWQKMIKIAENLDEYTLQIFTAKYMKNFPNTYVFTKKLAENIIDDYSLSLPCAIVRPSMVISSLNDPFPGWLDNIYGPIGLCLGGGKGVLRVAYIGKDKILNMVPVDFVIKSIIATAWKLGIANLTPGSPLSVCINCSNLRSMTMYNFSNLAFYTCKSIPLENIVWTLHTTLTDNYILFYILTILLHVTPAVSIDLVLKLTGRKPILMKMVKKLFVASVAVNHFVSYNWEIKYENNLFLMSSIPFDDQSTFLYNYTTMDMLPFLKDAIIGVKKFFLHEDVNRLDAAKAHRKRVYLGVGILKTIIVISILWMLYKYFYLS